MSARMFLATVLIVLTGILVILKNTYPPLQDIPESQKAISHVSSSSEYDEIINDYKLLVEAIAIQESGNAPNTPDGVCGGVGVCQIREIYVRDVNRICKLCGINLQFTYDDRKDPVKSKLMTVILLSFYSAKYDLDYFQAAQVHNGGPDGWRQDSDEYFATYEYATEVINILERLKNDRAGS